MRLICRRMISLILFSISLIISTVSHANVFIVEPKAGIALPTQVIGGQITTALYTVTNNTTIRRAGNYVQYLPPNVTQVKFDPTYPDLCGLTFNLAPHNSPNNSCTLELTISGSVNGEDTDRHHHLFVCFPGGKSCTGTNMPLNVKAFTPPAPTHAYIANYRNIAASNARNNKETIKLCNIDPNTGKLTSCQDSGVGEKFNTPLGIALNPSGTFLYVTNFNNGSGNEVWLCPINSNTWKLGECVNADADGSAIFKGPAGIKFNASYTRAYITNNYSNTVSLCSVNSGTGKFSGCMDAVADGSATSFSGPVGITFNAANTRAYVANNGNNKVSLCALNTTTGKLSGCGNAEVGDKTSFNTPSFISINASGTRFYVGNREGKEGKTVFLCSINLVTGKLSGCENALLDKSVVFSEAGSVTLNAANTLIYVSDMGDRTITLCALDSHSGKSSLCWNMRDPEFAAPSSVVLK